MAANYALKRPDQVQGLILWAAYPASRDNLTGQEVDVASIYATLDGLASVEQVFASDKIITADTFWAPVEGGNHAQFG